MSIKSATGATASTARDKQPEGDSIMRTANPAKRQFSTIVLACLASKDFTITKSDALKALENAGGVPARLSTYLWNAERVGFGIESIREGRTVTHLKLAEVPKGFDQAAFAAAHAANPAVDPAPVVTKAKPPVVKLVASNPTPKSRVSGKGVTLTPTRGAKPIVVRKAVTAKLTSRKPNKAKGRKAA